MASIYINMIVSADPTENVHTLTKVNSAELHEVRPMFERAVKAMQAELDAFDRHHGGSDRRPGSNVHGLGPDEAGGPNPHYKG